MRINLSNRISFRAESGAIGRSAAQQISGCEGGHLRNRFGTESGARAGPTGALHVDGQRMLSSDTAASGL